MTHSKNEYKHGYMYAAKVLLSKAPNPLTVTGSSSGEKLQVFIHMYVMKQMGKMQLP